METFNLNCDSYKDNEIEELLHLKNPYNSTDIINAKKTLSQQLVKNNSLGTEKQREILFFLDTIVQRITNKLSIINIDQTWSSIKQSNNSIIEQGGSTFLIDNPNRIAGLNSKIFEGRLTDSGNVPPGYINPINIRTISQAISIDTRFRPNYYNTLSTNFSMSLPSIEKNVVRMRVVSIEIPMTYYAVSKYSGNSTCLIINNANPTQCWVLTLPDGNYEALWSDASHAYSTDAAMNAAIQAAQEGTLDPTCGQVIIGGAIKLTATDLVYMMDRPSGVSVFNTTSTTILTSGFTIRFNVDSGGNLDMNTTIQLRLGWQLGFRAAEYKSEITNSIVFSEGICLMSGPRYGFLSINDYQKNTGPAFVVAYTNSIMQDNIITRLNLAAFQSDVGVYQLSSDIGLTTEMNRTREYFGPVDIQKLQISLYDEYGRIINLNNMDWSFTLNFERLYE
jgi:hypothetical protein